MATGQQFRLKFPQAIPPLEAILFGAESLAALKVLRQWKNWPNGFVALTGPGRSGVTSILKSWASEVDGRYLSFAECMQLDAEELSELLTSPLALDDADAVPNGATLLLLLNLAVEKNTPILLGGHGNPAEWQTTPLDVKSRLAAVTQVQLPQLDETNFGRRIRATCSRRFIDLPDETLSFLTARLERSYAAIEEFAMGLDDAMAATDRPASIPLAREVLSTLSEHQDLADEM